MYDSAYPRPAGRHLLAGVFVSSLIVATGGFSSHSAAQSSSVIVDESVLDQLGPPPQNLPRAILQRQDPIQRPQLQMPAPVQRPVRSAIEQPDRSPVQLTPAAPPPRVQAGRLLPPPSTMPKSRLLLAPVKPASPPVRRPERSRTVPPTPSRTAKRQPSRLSNAPRIASVPKATKPLIKTRKIPEPPVLSAPKVAPPKTAERRIVPPTTPEPIVAAPKATAPKAPPPPKLAVPVVMPPKAVMRPPPPKPALAKPLAPAVVAPKVSVPTPLPAPTLTAAQVVEPKPEVAELPKGKAPTAPPKALTPAPKSTEKLAAANADAPKLPSRIPPPAPSLESKPESTARVPDTPPQVAALTAPKAAPPSVSKNGDLVQIPFPINSTEIPQDGKVFLDNLAKRLGKESGLRIQLLGYAGDANGSPSKSRRLSLFRALSVRTYLMKKGIRSTRMDVRALGNRAEGGASDRVDALIRN